jgi:hypothetical protein
MVSDSSPEYVTSLLAVTGAGRLRAAFDLYWLARKAKATSVRQLHPGSSESKR